MKQSFTLLFEQYCKQACNMHGYIKMKLKEIISEYELDWAAAPVRMKECKYVDFKGQRIVIAGEQNNPLTKSILYSFLCLNDSKNADCQVTFVDLGVLGNAGYQLLQKERNDFTIQKIDKISAADYIIYTGACNQELPEQAETFHRYIADCKNVCDAVSALKPEKFILLSDYRVYAQGEQGVSMSEYEATSSELLESQVIKSIEALCQAYAKQYHLPIMILRTGEIFGAGLRFHNKIYDLADAVMGKRAFQNFENERKTSYVYISDVLTAIHFVANKRLSYHIFNVIGEDCTLNDIQLFSKIDHLDCEILRIALTNKEEGDRIHATMNCLRLIHSGWYSIVTSGEGIEILLKSMSQSEPLFVFENIYQGKINKIRRILLGAMLDIDRMCQKYNIKYSLAGGSLLGAIRHGGFIPWDDDLDIMMLREDYQKFCEVARKELPVYLFLQTSDTDKKNHFFSKIRINHTEVLTKFTGKFPDMNHGLFIDIFAHDKTANSKLGQKLHRNLTVIARSLVFNKWGNTKVESDGSHPLIRSVFTIIKKILPMSLLEKIQFKTIKWFQNKKNAKYLYDGMGQNLKRGVFPIEWLGHTSYIRFEDIKLPVITEYDNYLKFLYGEYMEIVPISERKMSHNLLLLDLGEYIELDYSN